MQTAAMEELRAPLADLGRRWAASPHRPRVSDEVLAAWDEVLQRWLASDLPLILRDGRRRGEVVQHLTGRELVFGDNSPANWSFALALKGDVPDLTTFSRENIHQRVPLSFVAQGEAAKRNLNKAGWKVCHISSVSDRQRIKFEVSPIERVEMAFRRFLSPRNIFLVPKQISGAGELPEVISAIVEFERTSLP
jgi:hypothetical protein